MRHVAHRVVIRWVSGLVLGLALGLTSGCGGPDRADSSAEGAGADGSGGAETTDLPAEKGHHFADVARAAGIDFVHSIGDDSLSNLIESSGGGGAFLDYDRDGYLDIYITNGAFLEGFSHGSRPRRPHTNRLYRNRGDGTFEDVTGDARVGDEGYGMGVVIGDYDNDGYPDIFVSNYGPNVLYHNEGDGTFRDVTAAAGVGGEECSVGAVWDFDNDGLLDLYVGNYVDFDPAYDLHFQPDGFTGPLAFAGQSDRLYRNLGDGRFEDVTARLGIETPDGRAMGVGAADYDEDGYVDIFVANDVQANYLFRNLGGEQFTESALSSGVAFGRSGHATSSMAVDFADIDADGLLDMYVSDMTYSTLFRNEGDMFRDVTYPAGVASPAGQFVGWSTGFFDYDNDGDPDLYQVNGALHHLFGQEDQLFENLGQGRFQDVSVERGRYFQEEMVGRGGAFGDYDNDGDVDVLIVNLQDRPALLRNEGGNLASWIELELIGTRSNRDAVGARVSLTAGGRTQLAQKMSQTGYLSQGDHRLHFGLGDADVVERIEIAWPSGTVQVLEDVPARQLLTVEEAAE
jgi:hypothetical protein